MTNDIYDLVLMLLVVIDRILLRTARLKNHLNSGIAPVIVTKERLLIAEAFAEWANHV